MSLETQIANLVAATNQLTGEVSGKMAAINQAVDAKKAELDAWRDNAKTHFSFPFARNIVVGGDAGKYYPMVFPYIGETFMQDILIGRHHTQAAPPALGADHVAGLTLQMKATGNRWSAYFRLSVEDYIFAYHHSVARVHMGSPGMVVWLRGGGMAYSLVASADILNPGESYGTPTMTPIIENDGTLWPQAAAGGGSYPFTALTEVDTQFQSSFANRTLF